jgi:hypothetical protein
VGARGFERSCRGKKKDLTLREPGAELDKPGLTSREAPDNSMIFIAPESPAGSAALGSVSAWDVAMRYHEFRARP